MATFISSTDAATLKEEGNDRNHFVSLIVNNAGTYTAAITRKLTIKKVISSTFTYKTFDDIEKTGVSTSEVEEEVIEYNMLDIIKEGEVANPFLEVDERLEIIRKNKEKSKEDAKKNTKVLTSTYYNGLPFTPYSRKDDNLGSYVRQGRLFDDFGDYSYDEEYMDSAPLRKVEPLDPNDTSPNISLAETKEQARLCAEQNGWLLICTHFSGWGDDISRFTEFCDYAKSLGFEFMTYGEAWNIRKPIYELYESF